MQVHTRRTDSKGRVKLPDSFANSTVVLEQLGDTEIRVRLAKTIPVDEILFAEDFPIVLSDKERDWFIQLLENTPQANPALRSLLTDSAND